MTQVVEEGKQTEVDCPGCKQKFKLTVKQKMPDVEVQNQEKIIETRTDTREHKHEPEPKPDTHQEIAESMPKGMNFAYCTGEDCGKKIINAKGITTKFKTCTNCKANTVPKSKKYCPTCGTKELEDEPFEESDVELQTEEGD